MFTSGCTSSQNKTTNSDLQFVNTPTVDYYSDGSGLIMADLINKGQNTYTHIDVEIIGYNENKEIVFKEKKGIASLPPGQSASLGRPLHDNDPKLYSVEMNVVNSTKT